jgi:hypothetical protein
MAKVVVKCPWCEQLLKRETEGPFALILCSCGTKMSWGQLHFLQTTFPLTHPRARVYVAGVLTDPTTTKLVHDPWEVECPKEVIGSNGSSSSGA